MNMVHNLILELYSFKWRQQMELLGHIVIRKLRGARDQSQATHMPDNHSMIDIPKPEYFVFAAVVEPRELSS